MSETIVITGNVGADPELKHTPGGVAIATFRVGSGLRRFDKEANGWVDDGTNWYSVSAFRSLADHAHASLRRGDRVVVTGRLRVRSWDNGTSRGTAVEIEADAVGHDLRWGTSVFTKSARPASATPGEGASDSWAVPGRPTDAWAEDDAPVETPGERTDAADPRPLALVGAEPPF